MKISTAYPTRSVAISDYGRMEPLWSPVVATGRNQWQIGPAPKPQEQAKTVAAGCDQLPFGFHGKEGVSGSSPELSRDRMCGGYGALCGAFRAERRFPFRQKAT